MADVGAFELRVDDVPVVVPCVEICLFLDTTDDALILDFYNNAREALGGSVTHYQAESMSNFKPLNSRSESMVATWFTVPRKGKLNYTMFMADGNPNEKTSASTLLLSVFRRPEEENTEKVKAEWAKTYEKTKRQVPRPASTLQLTLPLDHPLANWDKLQGWIKGLSLVNKSTSITGHCGLALNHFEQIVTPSLQQPAERALASFVQRYPGLGWFGGSTQAHILPYHPQTNTFLLQLKRANWLLIACDDTLSHLGGRAALRSHMAAESTYSLQELNHGVILRSGEAPEIGDLAQRDFLPLYRKTASLIRPVRLNRLGGQGPHFSQAATNEWLNAFDKEYL